MIRPEDTLIAETHTRQILDLLEHVIDTNLQHATTLKIYIEATDLQLKDERGHNKFPINAIETALLKAVAQRYAAHWDVTVRPAERPDAWFRFYANPTFRQRIEAQLVTECRQAVLAAGPVASTASPPRSASQQEILDLQHDARVLLDLAGAAQRNGRQTKPHRQAAATIAALLQTMPRGRVLPEGKLPKP